MVRKKVDPRVRQLIENSVKLRQRGLLVLVGDHGKDQVVNLHLMLSKTQVKARPSVLWCYKKELGFSTHRKKRMRQIKKAQAHGTHDGSSEDPFDLFVSQTDIRWTYYKDSHKVLGQTFGMLVLQDFEAMTPNLLARTVETVEGGGLVILLLRTVDSLKQLYTMSMDCHERFRTAMGAGVVPRFNERFILSLSHCRSCLVLDDELNILPISAQLAVAKKKKDKGGGEEDDDEEDEEEDAATAHLAAASPEAVASLAAGKGGVFEDGAELAELVRSLADAQPAGALAAACKTLDQARAVLTFLDAVSEKKLRSTVALTAPRGRGKSAALGLCLAGAIAYGYANVFVTAPSPENLSTVFEFLLKGLEALHYEEHLDFEVLQATHADLNKAVVRVNVFKEHRQTIQYIEPSDCGRLAQAELVIVDEAAAIPLPTVKKLLGPYLVFLASTVNGYEGTGRSLSLKLLSDLRQRQGAADHASATQAGASVAGSKTKKGERKVHEDRWATAAAAAAAGGGGDGGAGSGRTLREIELSTPIRYASGDPVESWLNEVLCLDVYQAHASANRLVCGTPAPRDCDLYAVDRDALFSHHPLSEALLQRTMAMYTAAHYKNSPNDLQMLSDAPAHALFVLLGPRHEATDDAAAAAKKKKKKTTKEEKGGGFAAAVREAGAALPDVLCVVQVCYEGAIDAATLGECKARGRSKPGDLIPWTLANQFGDDGFATLCGARIVRIATHPDVQKMGYGSRTMELLLQYFKGDLLDVLGPENDDDDSEGEAAEEHKAAEEGGGGLRQEVVAPRAKLPPLLVPAAHRRRPLLHWCGVSFGVTPPLLNFWLRLGMQPCYLRQTRNEVTGEHTAILLADLVDDGVDGDGDGGGGCGGGGGGDQEHPPPSGAGGKKGKKRGRPSASSAAAPAAGWLDAFVADARRRLVSLLAFSFPDFTAATALSLLGGGAGQQQQAAAAAASSSSQPGGGGGGVHVLTGSELALWVSPHDCLRLDLYARNMVDHHLVTDLLPTLARLFFLGHLGAPTAAAAPGGGGGPVAAGPSLSMVQKALLLGVGLQHRSVEKLAQELNLPVSQVLALFNKTVRKLNAHLKRLNEADAEAQLLGGAAGKAKARGAAKAAGRMTGRALPSLDADLQASGRDALEALKRGPGGGGAGGGPSRAASAASALVEADADLMAYAVKGADRDWEAALNGGGRSPGAPPASVSLGRSAAADGGGSTASGVVERVLAEAEGERAEAASAGKKKKRARILGGGFNETKEKTPRKSKKSGSKTPKTK